MIEADITIKGSVCLTMDRDLTVIEDPFIAIQGERIVYVGQYSNTIEQKYLSKKEISIPNSIILPGLINTHTHVPMVFFRGIADDLPLMEWLNHHIFPLEMKFVNKEMVYWGALLACAEMICSGTTTFCDGYFYPGRIARAAMETGLRVFLGLGFFDREEDVESSARANAETAKYFIEKWQHISPLVTPALFPHAPYTCRPETMKAIKEVAEDYRTLFITHLAETKEEVEIIRERYGLTPVRLLSSCGILNERTLLVHCNWLDQEEIEILAQSGTRVSHNAESGMKLASGLSPIPELIKKGICVGLGTDGCASNNDHDLIREMGSVAYAHKLVNRDPTIIDARQVLLLATREGARALGKEEEIGSIEVNKKADIIIIDTCHPRLQPLYNPYSQIVYAANGDNVCTTICNGRILLENRRLTTLDLQNILKEVERIACSIRKEKL
jgi:5-methylthioadenosine/S-adenosylhomocysteine deaminase